MNVSILWKSKKSSALLLLLASLLLRPALVRAEARTFINVQSQGLIWIMPPLGSDWKKLSEASFEEGSLLRLGPNSSIELKQSGKNLSAAEIEARIRIADPLIIRVDRHIFKELRFKDYVLDGLWGEGVSEEKEATSTPLLTFMAAYVRYLLSIDTAQELPKLKADPQKDSLEAAQKISNLPILSPSQDSLHLMTGSSAGIPLYWESPDEGQSFRIFVWPANDIKREPLATVTGHRYLLNLRKAGSYRLQISSSDFRYRSEVLRLTVDQALAWMPEPEALDKQFAKDGLKVTAALSFQYPPDALVIQAKGSRGDCLFVWSDQKGLKAGDEYKLIVQSSKGPDVYKVATQEGFAKLRLPPGSYHYFVTKQNRVKRTKPETSSSQSLMIVDGSRAGSWRRLGKKAQELARDETLLLDLR